jgi:predicted TIM-barrel fold metal-dependent hydrolase
MEPTRFEHMRRGAWDIHERIKDMDIAGVYASVNFPSWLPGFGGQRIQLAADDPELALACVRAWNQWHIEAWAGPYPDRIIPSQIAYLLDPVIGAEDIRRNAELGFKSVNFTEAPHLLGLPSLHTDYWDPIMQACSDTGTVLNLHIGSAGVSPSTAPDAPVDTVGALFFAYAMFAAIDWLYSGYPTKFPDLKIAMSEGGIGWVPALLDRLDHMMRYHEMFGTWDKTGPLPAEVLRRNFWFCAVEDPSTFPIRDRIGVENILVEMDYPHADSTWPDTQLRLAEALDGLPEADVRKITWENASKLYRHPVPAEVVNSVAVPTTV